MARTQPWQHYYAINVNLIIVTHLVSFQVLHHAREQRVSSHRHRVVGYGLRKPGKAQLCKRQ